MELYLKVRCAHFQDGLSGRQIARDFGISRDSVSKMLAYSEPPGYRRTAAIKRPKLDAYIDQIDQWLAEDKMRPRKQRHTSKRIFERLRDECGFNGGYTIVKDYVRNKKRGSREMFVPLSHPPGHAQADFGEALVVIGGTEQKAYFFALDLPHSDACYVRAYPAANTEAWLDGHVHAFAFFGAVPQSVLYDNDRCLVAKIMANGERQRTQRFSAMLSHYVIRDRFGRPGKGNDKGKVEGLVGYSRRNFMVPMPRFASWDAFNDYLEEQCCKRQADILRGHKISIGERLQADLAAMQGLPAAPFEACDLRSGQVTSTSVVRPLIRQLRCKTGIYLMHSQRCNGCWKLGGARLGSASTCRFSACWNALRWRCCTMQSKMRFRWEPSALMPSNTLCYAALNAGSLGWIWISIRFCPERMSRRHQPHPT